MAEHYRTGRRNHRVIYRQVGLEPSDDDVMVGSFDTAQLARLFVDSVNARVQPPTGETAEAILIAHQRRDFGSCLCGWSELGRSHPGHQVAVLRDAALLKDTTS